MSDLIDRQAAIEVIDAVFPVDPMQSVYAQGIARGVALAKTYVEQLPPAQPEQRWIPCSERLPDIKEHHVSEPCIVYCENRAYGFAELEENIFGQVGWNCERDDEYHEPLGEVIAWMPLPEPYKGR